MSLTTFMTIVMATVGLGALGVVVADRIPAPPRVAQSIDDQLNRPRHITYDDPLTLADLPVVYVGRHLQTSAEVVLDETPRRARR